VTWAFGYLVAFLVGLVLATVTGLLRDLPYLSRHHHLVVPHPDQQSAVLALLGRRLAVGLFLFGVVGLVAGGRRLSEPRFTFPVALGAGVLGFVLSLAVLRRPSGEAAHVERATVVREIPPGGYGQVRVERDGGSVVLAAQNVDRTVLVAGSEVEVVDCTHSVVTVRKQNPV
jgi:hypothetical protein